MKKAQPLVSIIVPIYNVGKYLPRTLDSLHKQTYQNFEVICVNDGSTDDCPQILQNMAQQDTRFVLINQKNQGIAATRNNGLQAARGQYIMFLDGDDYFHPQCVELAVKAITTLQTDICQFDYQTVNPEEIPTYKEYADLPQCTIYSQLLEKFLRKQLPISVLVWDKIYRAEIAKAVKFHQVRPSEDDLYSFETMTKAKNIGFIPAILQFYVQAPTSFMHTLQTATYRQNRRRVAEEYSNIVANLVPTLQQNQTVLKLLYRRFYKNLLFKEFILKPQRLHLERSELDENIKFLQRLRQQKKIDFQHFNLRFRIIFWLLEHRLYILARLLTA